MCKQKCALWAFVWWVALGLLGAHAGRAPSGIEPLTLGAAIKKALAKNHSLEQQKFTLRLAEITYRNAWDTMFMPGVSLALSHTQNLTLRNLPGDKDREIHDTQNNFGYPASSATLTLGSFTLFNFGKDLLVYEQALLEYNRSKEQYNETVRQTKFDVMNAYFQARSTQEKLDAATRSVQMAQAILDLVSSQVRIGKSTRDDVASAQIDLINAINEKNQTETTSKGQLWHLNQIMGEPLQAQFKLWESGAARFQPIRFEPEKLFKIYEENAPNLKNSLKAVKRAQLEVELKEKERLPVPKITFSGVNVSYLKGYYGNKVDPYTGTSTGNVNFDISATVNLTLPLTGPGGLFNSRVVETAETNLDLAESQMRGTRSQDQVTILEQIQQIKQAEESIVNLKKSLESATSLLDNLFKQVSNNFSSKRLELRDALKQAREAEIAYNEAIFQHLSLKLQLAQILGVDRLPGEGKPTGAVEED